MKFKLLQQNPPETPKEEEVYFSLKIDSDGDVRLCASRENGREIEDILCIARDGDTHRFADISGKWGFRRNDDGQIADADAD